MKYLITESQYHYLGQVLSEQTVYTDKKKYKNALYIYEVQKIFYDYFKTKKYQANDVFQSYLDNNSTYKKFLDVNFKGKGRINWFLLPLCDSYYRAKNNLPSWGSIETKYNRPVSVYWGAEPSKYQTVIDIWNT